MIDAIHWAGLDKIWLAIPFLLAVIFLIKNHIFLRKAVFLLANQKHFSEMFYHFSLRRGLLKVILWICAVLCLVFAIMRPQWGKREQKIMQEGRDLVILFDVSRSMLCKDIRPNRLKFAKLKVLNLLDKLKYERVALILFSSSAVVVCPLTVDFGAFSMFLNNIEVEMISSGSTAIDSAIKRGLELFSSAKERKNKLLLLLTDGEDFSFDLSGAKKIAAGQDAVICAIGIGSPEGAPVPILDLSGKQVGHEVDNNGRPVLSKLNEDLLQKLTDELGGLYVRAKVNDDDITNIAMFIGRFEKEQFEDKKIIHLEDRYPWFLGVSWFFLALEWIL